MLSRAFVSSFSLTRRRRRAASHSSGETIGGVCMVGSFRGPVLWCWMMTAGPRPQPSRRGTRRTAVSPGCDLVRAAAGGLGAALRRCTPGLGVGGLGEAFDGVEPTIPLPGDLDHGPGGLVEAVGIYPEEDLAALLSAADQPGLFEHDEVLGDGLAGEGDVARQPTGAGLTPMDEEIEHPTTRRVGDRRPQVVVRLGPHLLRSLCALGEQLGEAVQEISPAAVVLL